MCRRGKLVLFVLAVAEDVGEWKSEGVCLQRAMRARVSCSLFVFCVVHVYIHFFSHCAPYVSRRATTCALSVEQMAQVKKPCADRIFTLGSQAWTPNWRNKRLYISISMENYRFVWFEISEQPK